MNSAFSFWFITMLVGLFIVLCGYIYRLYDKKFNNNARFETTENVMGFGMVMSSFASMAILMWIFY
jgi:hypothetical protein